jgi:hypothetical protein
MEHRVYIYAVVLSMAALSMAGCCHNGKNQYYPAILPGELLLAGYHWRNCNTVSKYKQECSGTYVVVLSNDTTNIVAMTWDRCRNASRSVGRMTTAMVPAYEDVLASMGDTSKCAINTSEPRDDELMVEFYNGKYMCVTCVPCDDQRAQRIRSAFEKLWQMAAPSTNVTTR